MKNIVWTRIDDRLIHGQVMTQWLQQSGANEILIVDDGVAKDSFIQMVMKASVPNKVTLKTLSVEDALGYLNGEDQGEKIIILAKTPVTLERLSDSGIEFDLINVGGIGAKAGRKVLYKNISASDEEKESLRRLIDRDIDVFIQMIPSESRVKVSNLV